MKILYITNCAPWPAVSGTRQRNFHILEYLSRSHELKVVVLDDPPEVVNHNYDVTFVPSHGGGVASFPATVESRWRRRWRAICRNFLTVQPLYTQDVVDNSLAAVLRVVQEQSEPPDAVWISRSYIANAIVPWLDHHNVIVDYDEVMALREWAHAVSLSWSLHKLLTFVDVLKIWWCEQLLVSRVHRVLLCKGEDRSFFWFSRNKIRVVPNGAMYRDLLPDDQQISNRLLFVGLLSYSPNCEGISWFVRQCLPILQRLSTGERCSVDIVGADPPRWLTSLQSDTVYVRGFVDDLETYYRYASVVIVPILSGGGTKLKLLEALSYGKAVVATSIGSSGLDLRSGLDLEIADEPERFATSCYRLLRDRQSRLRLGQSGQQRVRQLYSWDKVGELAEQAIFHE